MPRHCSTLVDLESIGTQDTKRKDIAAEKESCSRLQKSSVLVALQCQRAGVSWRGLYPLLFQAPPRVSKKAFRILLRRFASSRIRIDPSVFNFDDAGESSVDTRYHSRSLATTPSCNLLCILPPTTTQVDYDFSGRLIVYEHIWLQLQTLSAWYATLGGGYFLCRQLSTAVRLARQQRQVAEWMGDAATADRCTLNEAYNYIHSGYFTVAFRMLKALKVSAQARNDTVLWNMCRSALLFGRRMKRAGKRVATESLTVDDYQRIRIVESPAKT